MGDDTLVGIFSRLSCIVMRRKCYCQRWDCSILSGHDLHGYVKAIPLGRVREELLPPGLEGYAPSTVKEVLDSG